MSRVYRHVLRRVLSDKVWTWSIQMETFACEQKETGDFQKRGQWSRTKGLVCGEVLPKQWQWEGLVPVVTQRHEHFTSSIMPSRSDPLSHSRGRQSQRGSSTTLYNFINSPDLISSGSILRSCVPAGISTGPKSSVAGCEEGSTVLSND